MMDREERREEVTFPSPLLPTWHSLLCVIKDDWGRDWGKMTCDGLKSSNNPSQSLHDNKTEVCSGMSQ